ncbi:hypothetical protein SteCoe_25995 [Stentor coeruleus]|uniref:Uncharacterized protein n=1 Tax=Stentor coeruleus TaxID=5963 RepID=A0A1R2BDW6_9CILI|nr:hypothetical protein SteCoe_25995 [Stentor coeruleus]
MNNTCRHPNCSEEGLCECSCEGNLRFCDSHIRKHSIENYCLTKSLRVNYQVAQARLNNNALDRLSSECVLLSQSLINEILYHLQESLNVLQDKKSQINELIFNDQKEEAERISMWANPISIIDKDKSLFSLYIRKLLSFNEDPITEQTLEDELKRKKFESACEKTEEVKNELKMVKIAYKEKKIQIKNTKKVIPESDLSLKESNNSLKNETKYYEELKIILAKDIECLKEQKQKLCLDLKNYHERKTSGIEDKKFQSWNDFKSYFGVMNDEEKIVYLVQNNFQDFRNDIVEKKCCVDWIKVTDDSNFLFICIF